MPRLTLVGFRGTGKSTVAEAVASRFGCGWHDADVEFERRFGGSVAGFFAAHGEQAFRDREEELLEQLLGGCAGVLSTGGGVVLRPGNRRRLLERGRPIVWLDASAEAVRSRLARDPSTSGRRPSLTGDDPFAEVEKLLAEREPLYAEVADLRLDTTDSSPEAVVVRIVDWLGTRPSAEGAGGG